MTTPLTKPNIIWVMSDDQETGTTDDTQAMPYLASKPHGGWVRFPNAVLSTPLCGPARANLLTGQRWDRHGVKGNDDTDLLVPRENTLIPVWMQAAGYRTGLFGKYQNNWPYSLGNYVPAGWNSFRGEVGPSGVYDYTLIAEDGSTTFYGSGAANHQTDVLKNFCVSFVSNPDPSPFFMVWTPGAPHAPIDPAPRHTSLAMTVTDPPDFNQADISTAPPWRDWLPVLTETEITSNRNQRMTMRRACRAIDEGLKDILDAVVAAGKINNTVVIYQTDNGRPFGRKRIHYSDDGIQKRAPYYYASDPLLAIRYPGVTNRTDTGLVRTMDLNATIASWAGATPPVTLDGANISKLILNGQPVHDTVEYTCHGRGESPITPWWAVRTSRWKYAEYETSKTNSAIGFKELYDLNSDPYEQVNLASDPAHAGIVSDMADRLAQLKANPQSRILASTGLTIRGRNVSSVRSGGQTKNILQIKRNVAS